MSSARGMHPSNRINRKIRRDSSPPVNRREKNNDMRRSTRSDHEKSRNDHDVDEDKEKDRKRKELNALKSGKQIRSPRKTSDKIPLERKNMNNQRSERKLKTDSKEKLRDKKSSDSIERHPLFQDNSRLAQLIAQITNSREDGSRRLVAAQNFYDYVYDAAHLESLKRNCSNIFSALEEVFQERGNNELKYKIVLCFGSIGHVLGIDCDKFFQWIFSKIPCAANDQLRVLYLSAISEAVQIDVGKQVFYDTMPMIMASLQEVLENADSPELLFVILDIVTIVAGDYPHIFAEYFRDTVDILVGWHIDTTQNEQLTSKTADCLISFHPYWVSDMRFSLTLLGQFLEDMEAYSDELKCNSQTSINKLPSDTAPSPHNALPKLTALTRVFTTVVSGLAEFFSPGREAKITVNFINDTVDRIITCVDICEYGFKFEQLLLAANDCLTALLINLGSNISASCMVIIQFINNQLLCKHTISLTLLRSAIKLMEKIVSVVGYSLPVDVVPQLIGEGKPLLKYRCHSDADLVLMVLKIFQTLLSVRNMPLLDTIYKILVKDLVQAYIIVLDSVGMSVNADILNTIKMNIREICEEKRHADMYDIYQVVVFDLVALAEIATFKSSVTGAWKVEPSSYHLLTKVLNPSDKKLAVHFPCIQFAILSTLYCHSHRCNNFVPTSNLKNMSSAESSNLVNMLCKIIVEQIGSADVKTLCITWLTDISLSISSLPSNFQKRWNLSPLVEAIVVLSYDVDTSVFEAVTQCITKLSKTSLFRSTSLGRLLIENLYHLMDKEKFSSERFKTIMAAFPADILSSLPSTASLIHSKKYHIVVGRQSSSVLSQNDMWLQCRRLMCCASTGYLHSYGFKVIMQYLLTVMDSNKGTTGPWVEHLYTMCQRLGKTTEPTAGELLSFERFKCSRDATFPFNVANLDHLQWFLLTWQAADFCILSRLKTPLGKALDTFQTIESVLKDLEARFKESNSLDKYSKENVEVDASTRVLRQQDMIKLTLLLLQFLEKLEKLMYNAFEGTATSLPPAVRPVRTFFRTNRSTCNEWLNRICGNVTKLAFLSGCTENAIRSGFLWLGHLKTNGTIYGSEFENAVITVVESLLQLHCFEAIQGVLEWSKKTVGRNFFWLTGAPTKAKGSLESAADLFKSGLHNYLSPDRQRMENVNDVRKPTVTLLTKDPVINADSNTVQFLIWQATDCYLQLNDWNEVQEWNKQVKDLQKKFPSVEGLHPTIDQSYVKAMMKFEENDFAGVHEQLDMIPGATMSNIMQEQFPVLGAVKEDEKKVNFKHVDGQKNFLSDNLTPQGMLYQSHIYLMQALTLYWTSGLNTLKGSGVGSLHSSAWETVDNLLTQAFKTAMIPLHTILMNGSSRSVAPFLMRIKSISAIRESLVVTDVNQDTTTSFMNVNGHVQFVDACKTDVSILNEALLTTNYLQFHHSLHKKGWVGPSTHTDDKLPNVQTLQVMTAKLARKQGNKNLAESLLAKQLSIVDGKMYLAGGAQLKLKQLSASANSGKVVDPLASVDILRESAKLKRTLGNSAEAIDVLCSSVLLSERQVMNGSNKIVDNHAKLCEVSSRSLVTLAKWIYSDNRSQSTNPDTEECVGLGQKVREVLKIVNKYGSSFTQGLQHLTSPVSLISEGDLTSGQLLQHSTYRCPALRKTWFAFADWCYRWGRKVVEQDSSEYVGLTDEEKDAVLNILPDTTPTAMVEKCINVLSKPHFSKDVIVVVAEVGDVSEEDKLKNQLKSVLEDHLIADLTIMGGLTSIGKNVLDRAFIHYKQAAVSYFMYLQLSGDSSKVADVSRHSEYGNITATLRLLRLLVKYSDELRQYLEQPLKETPTTPWKGIIPQLFARLNHPKAYVQNSVANLLCRIAKDSPELLVYSTVVGCSDMIQQQHLTKSTAASILRAYQFQGNDECSQPAIEDGVEIEVASQVDGDGISSPEDLNEGELSNEEKERQSSFHVILDTLMEDNGNLVQEVKCVIQELRRITLLWDELWLGSLTQLHQEALRRIQQLENEISRVQSNQTLSDTQQQGLIKEKHSALMKPLVYALERLQKITNQKPETPHEESFQSSFLDQINGAINLLKNPIDPSKPAGSWDLTKQLYQTLQSRVQKRPMSNLFMENVSPCLSKGNFTLIPLPGIESKHDNSITLTRFADEIQVLPTKTKPKKLTMIGSDGQQYPYLFKGLEDLHLDERIMQFLEICNHIFAKVDKSGERKYIARHYSVTPLGPRSGLIQWVDRSMPLFTLYRRWQQRNAQAQALLKSNNEKQVAPISPMRPTDLFYSKLTPLLKEKGIDINTSRRDWPIPLLKKILLELSNETPRDLLRRELWCSSIHAADWWCVTQAFARSAAVMSMIGYIIGLGDRHLDNILVDLTSGEVVHIDYNVCFEKGLILRVPEKVPFRMTPNIETALGVTGVEGIFRSSCEVVMQALRQGHEILLTLLEAFVYDPLIDWTTANDAAFAGAFYGGGAGADEGNKYSRKEMERGITQTLLSTRVAEMKVSWTKNRDELLSALKILKQSLNHYCDGLKHQWHSHEDVIMLQHQATLLSAALVKPDHPLHSLQSRYDKQAKLLADIKFWKQKLSNKLIECDQMCKQFQSIYLKVQGTYITNLYSEVCHLGDVGAPSYGAAVNFLNNAGQSSIVTQCEQIESELSSILNQRHCALRSCLESILSYSSIVNQFSSQYMKQHVLLHWMTLLSQVINEPTSAKCKKVSAKHHDVMTRRNTMHKDIEPIIISLENKLQQYFSEQNTKLIKLCERRATEPLETAVLSGPVTETWNALRKFVGDAGSAGATSLACVTITALSTLNKRQLVMEGAASSVAGDRLMHLTSRDGDWFLDELATMCSNISQLLSVLKNNPMRSANQKNLLSNDITDNISVGMQILFCSVKAYNSLQELMSNFRTIIVPEAIKSFLNNDRTVMDTINAMKKVSESCPVELSVICKKYQKSFKEKKELSEEVVNVVNDLKTEFEQLSGAKVEGDTEEGASNVPHMTPGQMLLAGFSGLFTKVEGELVSLYEFARKITIPDGYKNIDLNLETKDGKGEDNEGTVPMAAKLSCLSNNTQWLNFLFIKKLIIINGFFEALVQQSNATREADSAVNCFLSTVQDEVKFGDNDEQTLCVFNEELLCLQVKQFIAEIVQYFIIGLPSQVVTCISVNYVGLLASGVVKELRDYKKSTVTMDDLCKKVVEQCLKANAFPHLHLSQASSLINAHDVAWRKHDLARRLDSLISSQKEIVQRAQLQIARFQWLHEDIVLNSRKRSQPLASPTKVSVINEIKKKLQIINQVELGIPGLVEKYSSLQSSIEQRLKWGSGANPSLNVVLQNFNEAVSERKSLLLNESKLIPEVCNLGNAIVKMETFQSTASEANMFSQSLVKLIQKCDGTFKAFESCMGDLGDVEQFMKSLHITIPPTEPITLEWMKSRLDMIDNQLKQTHTKEVSLKNEIVTERDKLKSQVIVVKASFTSHHGLVGEVKSMLKTLAKDEDAEECMKVRKFIQSHNKFSEDSSAVLKNILSICSITRGDLTEQVVKLNEEDNTTANLLIDDLVFSVNSLHDQLLQFGINSLNQTGVLESFNQDNKTMSSATSAKKIADVLQRDSKAVKPHQEKNLYALNVWKRVKSKLEGRDFDATRRLAIAEQVDYVIREAVSQDNLCQLYEGWTPWV